ncbi:hypothetical protein [Paenibacillus sp. NPDC057934]|uniref:hypothetical protein n=1 Tax=Paenibacillus sp. NPDC057934 TaxID=3346282 RepID=UPI0036DCA7B8
MRENTIITLSYKELSQIVSIYFSQKLGNQTPTEFRIFITREGVDFEVKLWTNENVEKLLDFD